jgi:hypothetical protein
MYNEREHFYSRGLHGVDNEEGVPTLIALEYKCIIFCFYSLLILVEPGLLFTVSFPCFHEFSLIFVTYADQCHLRQRTDTARVDG